MPQNALLRFELAAGPPVSKFAVVPAGEADGAADGEAVGAADGEAVGDAVGEADADAAAVWKLPVAVPRFPAESTLRTRKKYIVPPVKPLRAAE